MKSMETLVAGDKICRIKLCKSHPNFEIGTVAEFVKYNDHVPFLIQIVGSTEWFSIHNFALVQQAPEVVKFKDMTIKQQVTMFNAMVSGDYVEESIDGENWSHRDKMRTSGIFINSDHYFRLNPVKQQVQDKINELQNEMKTISNQINLLKTQLLQ